MREDDEWKIEPHTQEGLAAHLRNAVERLQNENEKLKETLRHEMSLRQAAEWRETAYLEIINRAMGVKK